MNPSHSLTARINWANDLNENIEPFGGIVARSRGAVLESDDLMFALSHLWVGSAKMVNEPRFQVASREQTVDSLDPRCGGPCRLENQGGPTLEVLGVASVGRQRFTPQPRKTRAIRCSTPSAISRVRISSKAGSISTTSMRTRKAFRSISADGTSSAAFRPPRLRRSGCPAVEVPAIVAVQLGIPGPLRAGLRQFGDAVYLQ